MMDKTLVLSGYEVHSSSDMFDLAAHLEKNGIPTLLTTLLWPRDDMFAYPDGTVESTMNLKGALKGLSHCAYHGGAYLKGDGFLIGSDSVIWKSKRESTEKAVGVERGVYVDISDALDSISHASPKIKPNLYRGSFPHIDLVYGLVNSAKRLVTYDSLELTKIGESICEKLGYELLVLPLSQAEYVAVNFVEFDDKVVVDKRAKVTRKLIERLDVDVVPTLKGLEKSNYRSGGLHCMTNEIPLALDSIVTEPRNGESFWHALFYTTDGMRCGLKDNGYHLRLKN